MNHNFRLWVGTHHKQELFVEYMMKQVTFGAVSEAVVDRENEGLWYSKKELATIRRAGYDLFKESQSPEACLRGLENFQEGIDCLKKRRHNFVQALLTVQKEMSDMSLYDPKGLQAFASAHSLQDVRAARRRGKQDAEDVSQSKGARLFSMEKRSTSLSRRFQPVHVSDAAKCA